MFRLFGRLLREDITSPGALKNFIEKTAPMVALPDDDGGYCGVPLRIARDDAMLAGDE